VLTSACRSRSAQIRTHTRSRGLTLQPTLDCYGLLTPINRSGSQYPRAVRPPPPNRGGPDVNFAVIPPGLLEPTAFPPGRISVFVFGTLSSTPKTFSGIRTGIIAFMAAIESLARISFSTTLFKSSHCGAGCAFVEGSPAPIDIVIPVCRGQQMSGELNGVDCWRTVTSIPK